jgi:CheY-like chemotaxis protein
VTIQKVVNLTFADEGIDVITVGDGDTAMQKISESVPDVVLADVHMPGLSGYRICEIVRENPATRNLPVVLLVGSFEPFDQSEAERVGANAYLTKPFQSIRQLVSQVTELMASSAVNNAAAETPTFQEEPPAPPVRDTSDIESLYHQSFREEEPVSAEPGVAPGDSVSSPYVDVGMDDEMIETTYAAETVSMPTHAEHEYPVASSSGEGAVRAFESYATEEAHREQTFAEPHDNVHHVGDFTTAESTHVEQPVEPGTAEFTLDDIDLLELPPVAGGQTVEITAADGSRQVVNLSPELMEIIVDKVVEKISEKN